VRRRTVIAALGLWPVSGLSAGVAADGALAPEIARILQAGELRVAMYRGDFPPFFARAADGGLQGFDIALVAELCASLGVAPSYRRSATTWDAVVEQVVAGAADIAMGALSRTMRRGLRVAFTAPYALLRQGVLVDRLRVAQLGIEHALPQALDRPDVTIAVRRGTSFVEFLRLALPAARPDPVGAWDDGVQAVLDGRAAGTIGNEIEAMRTFRDHPEHGLRLRFVALDQPDPLAIAVNWRDTQLLRWLDLYLAEAEARGFLPALRRRYLPGAAAQAAP
jgi:ABC-type amino acid transport substrate-binding protein